MTLLWCLFFIGVISVSADLDYFKNDDLGVSFKSYEVKIPEGCDADINSCFAEHHTAAKFCVDQWKNHCGQYFDQCNEDPEMAQMSKTWQEASFHWHKAVENCLEGRAPPAEAASSSMFLAFLKRKKRSSHSGQGHHNTEANLAPKECFKRVNEKAEVCNAKIEECAPLARCWGLGNAPTGVSANAVTWFEHIKELRATTENSMKAFKTRIMECVRQKRSDEMKIMLKDFDMNALSSGMRHYNFSSSTCHPNIWQCTGSLHERALMCTRLQQTENEKSEKYIECMANDNIKQARSNWEKASGRWHKGLDLCMAGEAVPAEEEADTFFLRRKRSIEDEDEEVETAHPRRHHRDASHLRGHGPRVFANAAECWRDVATHRVDCETKAKKCTEYVVCSGMQGTQIPDDRQAWFDYSKQLRQRQKQTMEEYEKKLHDCLGTPIPARAVEENAE